MGYENYKQTDYYGVIVCRHVPCTVDGKENIDTEINIITESSEDVLEDTEEYIKRTTRFIGFEDEFEAIEKSENAFEYLRKEHEEYETIDPFVITDNGWKYFKSNENTIVRIIPVDSKVYKIIRLAKEIDNVFIKYSEALKLSNWIYREIENGKMECEDYYFPLDDVSLAILVHKIYSDIYIKNYHYHFEDIINKTAEICKHRNSVYAIIDATEDQLNDLKHKHHTDNPYGWCEIIVELEKDKRYIVSYHSNAKENKTEDCPW